jgi:hypothetical protein
VVIGKDETRVVRPGCPRCRKMINTSGQFVDHLANDAVPAAIEKAVGS